MVATRPHVRAVTVDGDLVGADWVGGGSTGEPSMLEIKSEVDEGPRRARGGGAQIGGLAAALAGAWSSRRTRQAPPSRPSPRSNESDAAMSAIDEQLGRLGQDAARPDDESSG